MVFTEKARGIISKKLRGERLSQQDSNYLSRFIRPKLREMVLIDAKNLLMKLEYNPKSLSIEKKIKEIILKNIPETKVVIICGSAVQTNYKEYNDIDIIIATKKVINIKKKNELINKIELDGKEKNLNLDIQIYALNSILNQHASNPSLIYQLNDSKIIYGKMKIPDKIEVSALDLKMKLDWSEGFDISSDAKEIYYALRNAMLILLLINKKIDNIQLNENLEIILGRELIFRLKMNKADKNEKKLAIAYLNLMTNYLENELKNSKWEKIEIENH